MATAGWGDGGAAVSKHGAFLLRTPHLSQAAEVYYQEPHPAQEPAHFQTSCESILRSCDRPPARDSVNAPPCPPAGSYYASALHPPHKPCMAQFLRSSNVPESSLPPPTSTPSSFPGDPQTAHAHASSSPGYPPRERMGPPSFHTHPGQPQYGPLVAAHGVYAPLYDSRRVWRPQVSPSLDDRSV